MRKMGVSVRREGRERSRGWAGWALTPPKTPLFLFLFFCGITFSPPLRNSSPNSTIPQPLFEYGVEYLSEVTQVSVPERVLILVAHSLLEPLDSFSL